MRKWLIGLALAGVTSFIIASRRKNKRLRLKGYLRQFIKALENDKLEHIMNKTPIDHDHWRDIFAGSVSEIFFVFWMKAYVGPDRTEKPGSEREYYFSWGGRNIRAKAKALDEDGEPNEFEQIHNLLRKIYNRLSDQQPS